MISLKISQLKTHALVLLMITGISQHAYADTDSCRCVAFRLDDIQDYYLNNVQMEIINTFQKKDASLTIGIIGNYFGNDQKIVSFVTEKLKNNDPPIEVANHGWNHEDFTLFDKVGQSSLIKKTNEKVFKVLGVSPIGFITPFNVLNNDTLTALHENDIQYISANVTKDRPPYNISDDALYHFPGTALTGNLNDDDTDWLSTTHKETFAQVQGSLVNYGFAVVMLHPQEYSTREGLNYTNQVDLNQIHELELLIDEIRNSGLRIVAIKEIPQYVTVHQRVPEWVKNIFVWYENKKITETEVLDAIHFLTKNEIIKFYI